MFSKKLSSYTVATLLLLASCIDTFAQKENLSTVPSDTSYIELLDLSFEELMEVTITTGTLSGIKKQNAPVAITTITAQDIQHSPARNLLDLLETYVPGALFMNHVEGPHPGMRGIIVDRSYKVLLLVNGKVLNQKARNGASTELENWDMEDIEKVEIIRGPGSVTYGPGAIMGVINIITKNASTSPGLRAHSKYVSNYRSMGSGVSYGTEGEQISFYGYASVTRTPGFSPNAYAVDVSTYESGYVGRDFSHRSARSNPVQRYYSDHHGHPQVKAYFQLDFLNEWTLWARYTTSGATVNGTFYQTRPQLGFTLDSIAQNPDGTTNYYRSPLYGKYEDIFSMSHQQFSSSLQNDHHFNNFLNMLDGLRLQTTIGYYSYSGEKGLVGYKEYAYGTPVSLQAEYTDKDSHWNQIYSFSESELLTRVLANIKLGNANKIAFGTEHAFNFFGPAWGKRFIKLQNINPYYSNENHLTFNINNDWTTRTYSFFAELNFKLAPRLTLLASGRTDKNTYSRWLISPRIALVSELNNQNVVKLIAQQSKRMNNAEELHSQHKAGVTTHPETLSGIELIYTRIANKKMLFNLSSFYNQIGMISWSGTDNIAKLTGNLNLAGLEAEARYTSANVTFGVNHSFTKQLKWKLAEDVEVSGISYSDYNLRFSDNVTFSGYGNDLNNWANHATKAFGRFTLAQRLTLHADTHVFWAFEGARDGLTMIKNEIKGSSNEERVTNLLNAVEGKNVYKTDLRFNLSASVKINKNVTLSAFAINMFSTGKAKRYSYDAGIVVQGPSRVAFVEEPRSFGLKLNVAVK